MDSVIGAIKSNGIATVATKPAAPQPPATSEGAAAPAPAAVQPGMPGPAHSPE